MSGYLYYPGCSVKGTGRAYEESLLAVFGRLGLGLTELDDWNCCGATAYMSVDEAQSVALAGRNLALAERQGKDLVTPCNACWLVLRKTQIALGGNGELAATVTRAMADVGLDYAGTTNVRHPLDVLVNDLGVGALREKVTDPLEGLRVAPYYGCQIVRPYPVFDDADNPRTMDVLLEAAGAEVVDFPAKTKCCGGSQTGTLPEIGIGLVTDLTRAAHAAGANVIATICPLCQFNLEAYQGNVVRNLGIAPIPVVYVTQLLGLALGLTPEAVGLHRSLIPVDSILERRTADVV